MSAPVKTKEDLTRLAWITELRRQGDRQCYGLLFSAKSDGVCALGLLGEIAGFKGPTIYLLSHDQIGALAGLSDDQTTKVICMNDEEQYRFEKVAEVVEGWFK